MREMGSPETRALDLADPLPSGPLAAASPGVRPRRELLGRRGAVLFAC